MKYYVRLGEATHEVVIDGESVAINGEEFRARLDSVQGLPVHVLSLENERHRLLVRRGEQRGQYELSIDGYRVSLEALDERSRVIRELSASSRRKSGPTHLVAPMPGLVVRVNVSEGDQVRAGQGLVVMEAMKMENELRATVAGRVRRVAVTPGSPVEKGAMLLEMEG